MKNLQKWPLKPYLDVYSGEEVHPPHFILRIPHSALRISYSPFHISHATFHIPHSAFRIPHFISPYLCAPKRRILSFTLNMLKKTLQFLGFLLLGGTIMYFVFSDQQRKYAEQCALKGQSDCSFTDKLIHDFSTVHLGWMAAVALAFTISIVLRALRWQMLLEPLGYKVKFHNSFLTIVFGYVVNLLFPRMGEVARAGALARYERLPMEKVMGTLVVDRLMDLVCMAAVVGLAFLTEGDTLLNFIGAKRGDGGGGLLSNPYFWGLIVLGVASIWIWKFVSERFRHIGIIRKINLLLCGFWEGLRSVFRMKNPGLFLLYSIGIWLMFYLHCWFNLKAFAPTAGLDMGAAAMVFVFGTLGMIIPSPGGMGTFHFLTTEGLKMYSIAEDDAFSYANIAFFSIQIFYNIVSGLSAVLLLQVLNRKNKNSHADDLPTN